MMFSFMHIFALLSVGSNQSFNHEVMHSEASKCKIRESERILHNLFIPGFFKSETK